MEFLRPEQLGEDEGSGAGEEGDRKELVGRRQRFKVIRRVGERIKNLLQAPFKTRRRKIITLSLLTLLLLLFLLVIVIPAAVLYPRAKALKPSVEGLQAALAGKDLEAAEVSLEELSTDFDGLEGVYSRLSYLRWVPFVNRYYLDGIHALTAGRLMIEIGEAVISSIRPYEEVLGLKEGFGSQITVEQQLANVLGTLPKLVDDLDAVWGKLLLIQKEVDEIDSNRYPQEVRGVKIRFWLEEAQKLLSEAGPLISEGRTILELAPQLLGSPKRTYLVLYQNAGELRATGGFITGYSLITVEDGKVLDNEFHTGAWVARTTPYIKPPVPLGKYLKVLTWHFQDANYSPDFPTSAKKVAEVWEKSGFPPVAGVVAINTETASRILELIGPLHMVGLDQDLSNNSNLPEDCRKGGKELTSENLICRLEYYAERFISGEPGTEGRKSFLGDLADRVIEELTSAEAAVWPQMVDLVFEFLDEKDLMIYTVDKDEQALIKKLGYAGRIKGCEGDYLHISDSNFGGRKTNMFMTESVEQSLTKLEDGGWRKTVRIKYYNPQPFDDWLSYYYKDFVRIYVPKGSKLVSVEGASQIWTSLYNWSNKVEAPKGWNELGKTAFGAYFTVSPQKEHILTFVYDLPESGVGENEYRLLMQKQSGTNIGLVKLEIGGKIESFDLETDQEIVLPIIE